VKKIGAHSYLLLELLVALTLVTLCILPFIRIPSRVVNEELLSIQRLQLQHMSDRTAALIKERIYKHEISWEQILNLGEKVLILEDEVVLPIKELAGNASRGNAFCILQGKKDRMKKNIGS